MSHPTPEQIAEWDRRDMFNGAHGQCLRIFQSGVFSRSGVRSPLFQSAVVQTLICLNDLLQKAKDEGHRISFTDHITLEPGVSDVTDLINKCRNAACHIGSKHSNFEYGRFRFNVIVGRGTGVQIGDVFHAQCEFDDDIAVYYGTFRLYLARHALRAFEEVSAALGVT